VSYRYRAAYGGRGSGKSHSFATALVLRARHHKLRVLCCREVYARPVSMADT
jgi:phage terminase large subunit